MNSLALLDYGQDEFELKSECKCGYKNSIHVTALYVSDPISAIASSSNIEFEDNFACPNPMAFAGPAFKVSARIRGEVRGGFHFYSARGLRPRRVILSTRAWGVNFDVSVGLFVGGSIRAKPVLASEVSEMD